jgi:hypothetical protein|tara:strand:- start:163 stop:450 length:288 start_codon:yes stop_codon:yes gene_type:complete
MSNFPKVGMKYEDARKRARRIGHDYRTNKKSHKGMQINLIKSLTNQVALHEGDKARDALNDELVSDANNHSSPRCGWSKSYGDAWKKLFGKAKEV